MIDPILFILFFVVYIAGACAGAYVMSRHYNRTMKRELYDFDRDKTEFDEWIAQRMAEVKRDQ